MITLVLILSLVATLGIIIEVIDLLLSILPLIIVIALVKRILF